MSGRASWSTRTGMKRALISSATFGSLYVTSSMTWHQWHHTASRSNRTKRFSRAARSNTASDHGSQAILVCDPAAWPGRVHSRHNTSGAMSNLRIRALQASIDPLYAADTDPDDGTRENRERRL